MQERVEKGMEIEPTLVHSRGYFRKCKLRMRTSCIVLLLVLFRTPDCECNSFYDYANYVHHHTCEEPCVGSIPYTFAQMSCMVCVRRAYM